MEVSYIRRPYKISKNGQRFKGIVAANLAELKEKSIQSLQFEEPAESVEIFLAEDDTLVDDQDYFATIPENTKLLVKLNSIDTSDLDHTDGPSHHEVSESQEFSSRPCEIPRDLANKITQLGPSGSVLGILSMSNSELETLIGLPLNIFVEELNFDLDIARVFLDSAGKELTRRSDLNDATNLLKLYDRAKANQDRVDGGKRKKI
ncbi:DNA fragmentation factor subunit alpha-like [Clytia hemisphaerica]|uniref:DNA fragmentation factor subunit alpha-like n=1 Tax=Clytia hemisphaerica TaxID=252671 RepID=UPI0034D3F7D6